MTDTHIYFSVDPEDVIRFDRTDEELQVFWLFCGVVAGKTSTTQARLLAGFLSSLDVPPAPFTDTPFNRISWAATANTLLGKLKESRLGQYNRLYKFMTESLTLDLRGCSVGDLEAICGCGPKTARMFLMFSREGQRFAALDTHILRHLRDNGIEAPLVTPPAGEKYRRLEAEFIKLADASGLTVAEYDLKVWTQYSGNDQ